MAGRLQSFRAEILATACGVAIAALTVTLAAAPSVLRTGPYTVAAGGMQYDVPGWTNESCPSHVSKHCGFPGSLEISFSISSASRIIGTLTAPRPFGLVIGDWAWAGTYLCGLSNPPVPCAIPVTPEFAYPANLSTSINLSALSLGFVGPNNELPSGHLGIVLYNLGFADDPVVVSTSIVVTPIAG